MKRILILFSLLYLGINLNATTPQNFPYPNIPDSIITPKERAAFLIEHFWDRFNFMDTIKTSNTKLMEQHFVDFISVFPHTTITSIKKGINNSLNLSKKNIKSLYFFTEMYEKYFYEISSPMRSEQYFRLFLENVINSSILNETHKLRYKYLYEQLEKNKIGEKAPNFEFFSNYKEENLYNVNSKYILLLFYDYNCNSCKDLILELKSNTVINDLINNKTLNIISICTNTTMPEWIRYKKFIPETWINGYDSNDIINSQDKYITRELPAMFLLNKNKEFLLKEPLLPTLIDYLNKSCF